jgi:catechol 2,3-dioxygenase-like lactoylglutathione lyase family enzyme
LLLQPMVHVDDMAASIAFYEHLGAEIVHGSRESDRVLLQLGTTQIGLVAYPPSPGRGECTVELNFAAAMPLDELEAKLRRDGISVVGVAARTDFGAQLLIRTPDGMIIKINQLEPDSYT